MEVAASLGPLNGKRSQLLSIGERRLFSSHDLALLPL
jgi:hypothetical protein